MAAIRTKRKWTIEFCLLQAADWVALARKRLDDDDNRSDADWLCSLRGQILVTARDLPVRVRETTISD